jgi:hypothetical protein
MNIAQIYATIYTSNQRINMAKICNTCRKEKDFSQFYSYRVQHSCISCLNEIRRNKYKKSICRHCSLEFRPGIEGRYKFCEEKCRFLSKVKKEESGCWIWQASKNNTGYGCFVFGGKKSGLAHRASYKLFKGELPDSMGILHSCHVPLCVAPDHLRSGTQLENNQDTKNAGREKKLKGSDHPLAKITEKDVLEIRDLAHKGESFLIIGQMFGFGRNHIRKIVKREIWKHVE